MKSVGIRELKARAPELVREVAETGQSLIITNRGRAVARLVPNGDEDQLWANTKAAIRSMERIAKQIGKNLSPGTSAVKAVREQRRDL